MNRYKLSAIAIWGALVGIFFIPIFIMYNTCGKDPSLCGLGAGMFFSSTFLIILGAVGGLNLWRKNIDE